MAFSSSLSLSDMSDGKTAVIFASECFCKLSDRAIRPSADKKGDGGDTYAIIIKASKSNSVGRKGWGRGNHQLSGILKSQQFGLHDP